MNVKDNQCPLEEAPYQEVQRSSLKTGTKAINVR